MDNLILVFVVKMVVFIYRSLFIYSPWMPLCLLMPTIHYAEFSKKDVRNKISVLLPLCSPLSLRLSWPPAAICAKPTSRPRKFQLNHELAEKNMRLSRQENCGSNTKIFITKVFSILKLIANCHCLLCYPSLALLCFLCVYV